MQPIEQLDPNVRKAAELIRTACLCGLEEIKPQLADLCGGDQQKQLLALSGALFTLAWATLAKMHPDESAFVQAMHQMPMTDGQLRAHHRRIHKRPAAFV